MKRLPKIYPDNKGMRDLADLLKNLLPNDFGFVLLTYKHNETHGLANYVSTSQRDDIIKFLRETANRLEFKQDIRTPNNN
jgi:hypothetical protein